MGTRVFFCTVSLLACRLLFFLTHAAVETGVVADRLASLKLCQLPVFICLRLFVCPLEERREQL